MAWPGTPSARARMIRADVVNRRSLRRSLVRIVMAFDQHREQIAFDALDTATGEVSRGRIRPADRLGFRRWLRRWDGAEIEAALEATTGWRFMVEELRAVGAEVHLAEPAETSARRGPKKRAKTDRQDARRLRELLQAGRVPESWIPPEHILEPLDRELRSLARRQPGCRALMAHYGVGEITSLAILAELGDAGRFSSSRHAVRYAGLDITVFESDRKRAPGISRAK